MPLTLDSDAALVRETALEFFRERAPVTALRKLRDDKDPTGFSRALWREMAALGWTGFLVAEDAWRHRFRLRRPGSGSRGRRPHPGGDAAAVDRADRRQRCCRSAAAPRRRARICPPLVAGERLVALALEEGAHHAPYRIATTARRNGEGWRLERREALRPRRPCRRRADRRGAHRREPRRAAGHHAVPRAGRRAGRDAHAHRSWSTAATPRIIRFDGVAVGADAVLGPVDGGADLLERVLDRARAGLAAEMLGSAAEAFERTVQYLKDRKQFGVPIGTFQALKHRAAQMFCEIELTRSAVHRRALRARCRRRRRRAPSPASPRPRPATRFFLVGNEGVQMHGGIGMTDEHEIGFFLKRARVAQASFGDAAFQRRRYADLSGY